MLAAGDRMERLVGQILRGTDNDPRARPVRVSAVGAGGIAYALAAAFDRQAARPRAAHGDRPAGDLPPMRTDAALVHEILSELVANAATYTPRGGTITLAGRALPGGGVELAVRDTGPGIRGRRAGGGRRALRPGRGCERLPRRRPRAWAWPAALAERLGGRLTLEPGPGGRARLELPGRAAARGPRARRSAALSAVGATSP